MADKKTPVLALLIIVSFALSHVQCAEKPNLALVAGLSYNFYQRTCPQLQQLVRKYLRGVFAAEPRQAPILLRVHFHDCFVRGCQGSMLIDATDGEKTAPPNQSFKPRTFEIIEEIKQLTRAACGDVVSCTDIEVLAARDAVYLSGGPDYFVPLGRRDALTHATKDEVLANLPSPFNNTDNLLVQFGQKGFNAVDLVALSGAHTIGIGHCFAFTNRLYPNVDPAMDPNFAAMLKLTCPAATTDAAAPLDPLTPNVFDSKYYCALQERKGLLFTDQDLYTNLKTKGIVSTFAASQDLFFLSFINSMTKLGQFGVLTGTQGQVRTTCNVVNGVSAFLKPTTGESQASADI